MPDDRIEVTVFEGVVEIVKEKSRATDQPLRLGIGQAIATQADKVVLQQLAKPALEHKLAWLEDRLVFDRLSLGEAVTQVNRYSALPLRVVDPELTGVLLSGAFSTSEIPVFINSLEQGFGLHVERTAGAYLISKASAR